MLTLEQFTATKITHEDLRDCGHAAVDAFFSDASEPKPGLLYECGLYIQDCAADKLEQGRYYLQIANLEWVCDDLASLEAELYDYYTSEHLGD